MYSENTNQKNFGVALVIWKIISQKEEYHQDIKKGHFIMISVSFQLRRHTTLKCVCS